MSPPQLQTKVIIGVIVIREAHLRSGAPSEGERAGELAAKRSPAAGGDPGADRSEPLAKHFGADAAPASAVAAARRLPASAEHLPILDPDGRGHGGHRNAQPPARPEPSLAR